MSLRIRINQDYCTMSNVVYDGLITDIDGDAVAKIIIQKYKKIYESKQENFCLLIVWRIKVFWFMICTCLMLNC